MTVKELLEHIQSLELADDATVVLRDPNGCDLWLEPDVVTKEDGNLIIRDAYDLVQKRY